MDIEQEFMRWLRRAECTFAERLLFAIKAWQSLEFTNANKYELILNWLAEELDSESGSPTILPIIELTELLGLRAHPGLISTAVKTKFITALLALVGKVRSGTEQSFYKLLRSLLCNEVMQDIFRADYILVTKVYAALCRNYETYLQQMSNGCLDTAQETEFFHAVLQLLMDYIKRIHDLSEFDKQYNLHLIQPLAEVLLILRTHALCFNEEFAAIEQLLTEGNEEIIKRISEQPLHVRLLALECTIINRPGDLNFHRMLLEYVFCKFKKEHEHHEPRQILLVAAFTLEMLRKHDISLVFDYSETNTALNMVGNELIEIVSKYRNDYLRDVLLLLCAAMRLNPLLLEQHIFQVTTWMLVAPKNTDEDQSLYEQYAVLLMDMFRRMNRAERFLGSLLKVLKEWLCKYNLPSKTKGKRAAESSNEVQATPSKHRKSSSIDTQAMEPHETAEIANTTTAYLRILFQELLTPKQLVNKETHTPAAIDESFPALKTFWPSTPVGNAFSKLVANLMSKPSIVIWSTLLHELKILLDNTKDKDLDNNALFAIDLHAALLCQYFRGSRIAEQSQKFATELSAQRALTNQVLAQFGRFLLAREHNQRTVNAFLECSYYAGAFELLLTYYMLDGPAAITPEMATTVVSQLHGYLSESEWTLMQQRVLNFGKRNCKQLFDRLQLQRVHSKRLLRQGAAATSFAETASPIASLDFSQLVCMLTPQQSRVRELTENDKLVQQQMETAIREDLSSLELHATHIFATYADQLATSKVCGSLSMALHESLQLGVMSEGEARPQSLAAKMNAQVEDNNKQLSGELPMEQVALILVRLRQLPLAHLRCNAKTRIFLQLVALYHDLLSSQAMDLAAEAFDYILDFLHFGAHVAIFKCFTCAQLLALFPVRDCLALYKLLLNQYILQEVKGGRSFLQTLVESMQTTKIAKLSEAQRQLLLLVIETIGGLSGPRAKRMQKQLAQFMAIYELYVKAHFQQNKEPTADATATFVQQTLPAYAIYVKVVAANSAANNKADALNQSSIINTVIDEDFRRICKIYIGHSLDYRNRHSLRLINVALNHRQQLHLDQDEIELALSSYWRQLNEDLRTAKQPADRKCLESAIELIIANKTNEDLLLTLRELNVKAEQQELTHASNVLVLLALIAKCGFSTIKGAIFNEHFKQLTTQIFLQQPHANNHILIAQLHACQMAIVENKTVPLSTDTLDSILACMLTVNVKKFAVTDEASRKQMVSLHASVSELCMTLLKHRTSMLMDRVPQLMHIFKSQLQAIVWYKSDRQKASLIAEAELDDLASLALKLATLMQLVVATLAVGVKRVAPLVLTFAINLMVANERPTTLYQKIKLHVEGMCYDLIGLCDHRVGNFILRSLNEASRELYKLLYAEHKKYHKFKGKV